MTAAESLLAERFVVRLCIFKTFPYGNRGCYTAPCGGDVSELTRREAPQTPAKLLSAP